MRHSKIRTSRIPGVRYVRDDIGRQWPVPAGGSGNEPPPNPDQPADPPAPDPNDDPPDDDPGLGDAGKRALRAERRAKAEAEKRAKEAEAELQRLRDEQKSDAQKAIDEAREQARQEALEEARRSLAPKLAAAKAESLASSRTSDPALAVAALGDLTQFVGDDGQVDTDAMSDALDDVIEKHPALAIDAATTSKRAPDLGQGRRPGSPKMSAKDKGLEEARRRFGEKASQ